MKIKACHGGWIASCRFCDSNVIEASEAGTIDFLRLVIRYEESFLPSHKRNRSLPLGNSQTRSFELPFERSERRELAPVFQVILLRCAPVVRCEESKSRANDFCIKVSRHHRVVLREVLNTEIATKRRGGQIHINEGNVNVVAAMTTLLAAIEYGPRI